MAGARTEFAGTLRERIVIERPVADRTAMGLSTGGWETVARAQAAIVPDGAGAEREGMALSAMARFRVSIRPREGIAIDQRILWGQRVLMIRQLSDEPQRGDRIVMRCEEVRA